MPHPPSELSVQANNILQLYNDYLQGRFVVNRRYQRKLVWTVEEKERLIDSISKDLPIPLILLAETRDGIAEASRVEVIDGLQRLNAIFSFIENEFSLAGKYFDLETLGDTKLRKDRGILKQQGPILNREICTDIANYQVPVSIYRASTEGDVDEVFRRINSSGKHLSLQEIRQAGATDKLAQLIRRLAAIIRGDVSYTDYLPLSEMKKISITNHFLDYGIYVDNIFWVQQGILTHDSVRESRDEELILDIVLDMIVSPMASTGSRYRDSAYGINRERLSTSDELIHRRLTIIGADTVERRFLDTLEIFRSTLLLCDKPFAALTVTQQNYRGVPRHFHALFIAVSQLMEEGRRPKSSKDLAKMIDGFWDHDLKIPSGGGDWGAERKARLIEAVKSQLRSSFPMSEEPADKKIQEQIVRFEASLRMALTEESLLELKQGFCDVQDSSKFNASGFEKILRTATAMANSGPNISGQILIGVADDENDAHAIESHSKISVYKFDKFFISGTQHELDALHKSVDEMWRDLISKIRNSKVDPELAAELAKSLAPLRYRNYLVWKLEPHSLNRPVTFDGRFFQRIGPQTVEATGNEIIALSRRFPQLEY